MMGVVIGGVLFACYAVGFNVIFGSTGQLFLCTGALAGFGGYASAILSDRQGLPLVLAMLLATLVAATAGGLLSWIAVSRSLGVIFTGIVTLAFALAFQNLLLGQRDLTGGETGLVVEAGSDTLLGEQVAPFYVFVALLAGYLALFRALQRSHIGWAFRYAARRRDRGRAGGRRRQAVSGPGGHAGLGDDRACGGALRPTARASSARRRSASARSMCSSSSCSRSVASAASSGPWSAPPPSRSSRSGWTRSTSTD